MGQLAPTPDSTRYGTFNLLEMSGSAGKRFIWRPSRGAMLSCYGGERIRDTGQLNRDRPGSLDLDNVGPGGSLLNRQSLVSAFSAALDRETRDGTAPRQHLAPTLRTAAA